MRDWTSNVTRISLDVTPEEKKEIQGMSRLMKTRTISRYIRKALRFYAVLAQLHAKGYTIQAIKKGDLRQFPNLDAPGFEDD